MDYESYDPVNAASRFFHCEIKMERLNEIKARATVVLQNEARYTVMERLTGIPWWITGVIHNLESTTRFDRHLHNGDPLTGRTVHVPAGRPVAEPLRGAFPYSWEESAADALKEYPPKPGVWDVGHALIYLEAYNGFGYRGHGIVSPYVWCGTTAYSTGKFGADGVFDATLVSEQAGAAAIIKCLANWKVLVLG